MRGQECDRPRCLAVELAKIGAVIVAPPDYDTLYIWPVEAAELDIVSWHRNNNAGDRLKFHVGSRVLIAEMPE